MRTADIELSIPDGCPEFIREGLERGTAAVPVSELRKGLNAAERRFRDLVGSPEGRPTGDVGSAAALPALALSARSARPVAMG
jgi:hypothetical protein